MNRVGLKNSGIGSICIVLIIFSQTVSADVRRVTAGASGDPVPGAGGAELSDISPDGTYVAFYAQKQLLGTNPGGFNAYLRNVIDGSLHLASVNEAGAGFYGIHPTVSANGLFAAFENGVGNRIYRYDRVAGTSTWINKAMDQGNPNGACERPIISADGRYIAFFSRATNLLAEDTNGKPDIYLYDHQDGSLSIVSRTHTGSQVAAGILGKTEFDFSRDGRYIFFSAKGNDVTSDTIGSPLIFMCYRHTLQTGAVELVSLNHNDEVIIANFIGPRSSYDGTKVAFAAQLVGSFDTKTMIPGHSNPNADVYVRNLVNGDVWLGSSTPSGAVVDSSPVSYDISGDGTKVAFSASALNIDTSKTTTNIRDVFEGSFDRDDRSTTVRVSIGPAGQESNLFSDSPVYAKQANLLGFTADDFQPILGIDAHGADEQGIVIGDFPGGAMSGFADWVGGFGLATTDLGPDKDPDNDNVVNLMEFIADSDPSIADTSRLPIGDGVSSDLTKFRVIVHVRKDLNGVSVGFDVATKLGAWSAGTFTKELVIEDLGNVERIRFEISIPQSATQLFVRFTGVAL